MRFWVDARPGDDVDIVREGVRVGLTRSYYEWELAHGDFYEFVYVIPRGLTTVFYAVSWRRAFDSVPALLREASFKKELARKWPTIARLFDELEKKNPSGLVQFEDYDTGEPNWFIGSVVEGVDPVHPATWGDRGFEAQSVVRSMSLIMIEELATVAFDAGRPVLNDVWRSFADGFQESLLKPTTSTAPPRRYPLPHPTLSPGLTPPILDCLRAIDIKVKQ